MCGIAGIWGELAPGRLKAMTDSLRHRGPDDEGFWTSEKHSLGLGHRRLSIIDLGGGQQPIFNEDGRIVTVFNGEIYNYKELRQELITRGHEFATQTDTEVIVHLYEEHGTDLARHLRGMFAIALWDDREGKLVLIRDRVGKKPIYFSQVGGEFLFASELKGVVAGSRAQLDLDEQSLADYFAWAMVLGPRTIYRQVQALQPGELMVVRDRQVARTEQYWQLRMQPKVRVSRRDAVDQIDEMLHEAVRLRLRSDVPVGCFLSGGIDSGIVTAIAAQQSQQPLTTVTIGFEDDSFDERPLARLVAEKYGTDHHEVVIQPKLADDLIKIARAYDQPFGGASAVPSYYVARAARQFVKVVLNGDGGDELFAGYRRYLAARLNGYLRWADGRWCRPAWQLLARILPVPRGFRSGYAFAHRMVRGMSLERGLRQMAWSADGADEEGMRRLCGANGNAVGQVWFDRVERSDRLAEAALAPLADCGPVDRMLGVDFSTILPHNLLVKMDIATMAHGLEARSPLLDNELIDLVSHYPERVKLYGRTPKPLLRELSARYVPQPVQTAPKRGFEIPLVRWLRGDLRSLCEDVVLARDGVVVEMFDRAALEDILRKGHELDPARWSRRVWLLLMLGMWDRAVNKPRQQAPAGWLNNAST